LLNKVKQNLESNKASFGTWIQIGHPACAEILASCGFDWICVDMEHGAIDLESMTNIFRTVEKFDCIPMVRVPKNDYIWIHRALDAGARGIIIPMVSTVEEAKMAVQECKYPPDGTRGFGYSRANLHSKNFDEHIGSANDDIVVVLQIEHIDAIDNLEEILDVEGVDATFIGPMDLSGSMGITGQLDHLSFRAVLNKYLAVSSKKGIPAGTHDVRPSAESVKDKIEDGYSFIALGVDSSMLLDMGQSVASHAGL
jgi:2-dehydro-3-deoxyglucarate aldolase